MKMLVEVYRVGQVVELSAIILIVRFRLRSTSITLVVLSMFALVFLLNPLVLLILVVEDSIFDLKGSYKAGVVPEEGTLRTDHRVYLSH